MSGKEGAAHHSHGQIDPHTFVPPSDDVLPHVVAANPYFEQLSGDPTGSQGSAGASTGADAQSSTEATPIDPGDDSRKPTPLQRLLNAFVLEGEKEPRALAAFWDTSGVGPAPADPGGQTKDPDASGADLHMSDSAKPFPDWHLTPNQITDAGAYKGELKVLLGQKLGDDSAAVASIKEARAMLPVIEQTPKAQLGKLRWVKYPPRKSEGWMFAEPEDSKYGQWLKKKLEERYTGHEAAWNAIKDDPTAEAKAKVAAQQRMLDALGVMAIKDQEGAPSAINTWDGLVLTWGIGIAGPGKLPETFEHIGRNPNVRKAMYLCGFICDAERIGHQFHGVYQAVDLRGPIATLIYRDNRKHKLDKSGSLDTKEHEGQAYKALKYMVSQLEGIYLLIQLARDPLTRETIFEPNYRMIVRMARVDYAEKLKTQALYVFAAQVKHNWGFGPSLAKWAMDRFDATEAATNLPASPPSMDRDKAIAKGIVRYLLSQLQRQRWDRAVKQLRLNKKKAMKSGGTVARVLLATTKAHTEYGLTWLIERYWRPLQRGAKSRDGVGVPVADFWTVVTAENDVPVDNYPLTDWPKGFGIGSPVVYDCGPRTQMDLLFPHNDVELVEIDVDGNIKTLIADVKSTINPKIPKTYTPKGEEVKP